MILVLSLIFDLGLLAYAMYALLGILFVSRYLTSNWAESLTADRECNRLIADVGDSVAVVVNIQNNGMEIENKGVEYNIHVDHPSIVTDWYARDV